MSLHKIDLTTALRPLLLPDETLLFVQDSVGLYEGKFKLPDFQNGHVYLTTHRACYVSNEESREYSVAVGLKEIDRAELYAGFLKSSPKVILYPKTSRRLDSSPRPPSSPGPIDSLPGPSRNPSVSWPAARTLTPVLSNATWICPICTLSNLVPPSFDPAHANASTPLPPCQACGIKPPLALVLKASISNQARQSLASPPESTSGAHVSLDLNTVPKTKTGVQCPRCTFLNHASLPSCEICGLSLTSLRQNSTPPSFMYNRLEPPGPTRNDSEGATETTENLKFSFRNGGEKVFLERFRGALVQRKWLLQSAPPVPKPSSPGVSGNGRAVEGRSGLEDDTVEKRKHIGIAGLEHRGFKMRQNNEAVIGTAFEDLEALMTSAKEIIQLAESFSGQIEGQGSNGENFEAVTLLSRSVDALGLVATKDMLTSGNAKTESLYLSELSRQLAEFLTDDRRGVLHKEGGMISLVDLWAVFNRARGGVELVSPNDFEKSARLWEQLRLPVRLRQFKSGLLVVQSKEWTDDKTIAELLSWLAERHETPPMSPAQWNWQLFGQGVTAQELADRFKWSIAVATEELDMAEEKGVLCREESVEGVRFWENYFLEPIQPANTHEIA